jgi:methionine aminopeptidase
VLGKYARAAEVANTVMLQLVARCVPGSSVMELCQLGDAGILELMAAHGDRFGDVEQGIALPTAITLNHMVGFHVETAPRTLAPGDLVTM